MNWRGTTDTKDRIFGALPYILPLIYAFSFGIALFQQFPIFGLIYVPLAPLMAFYFGFPFAQIIVFFILFLAVVRNESISYFIRFNTLQAILIDILLFLIALILGLVPSLGLLSETLNNVVFLGTLAVCGYSMVQSFLGRYAEIPNFSQAVYAQLR
ncbi:MAG: Tic20 family protein [Cyanobacteriota bacterium]|nr:Tic20 family protein [Cyanobacteriota bacterium]